MQFILPIAVVTGIGLISGAVLTLASKFMAVEVNEAVIRVREVLPGANCGACGYAGCDDYASAIVANHFVKPNLCTPGGSAVALEISNILQIDFESVDGKYAFVKCSGTYDKTSYIMDFKGIQSCTANTMFYRGRGACLNACLGYGDCVEVCKHDAIRIVNGVAAIDKNKCTACGLCVKKCPNSLIQLLPVYSTTYVGCTSPYHPSKTLKVCKAGCIACKKCEKVCKHDAIHVTGTVAVIDPEKCKDCGVCMKECPVGVIKTNKQFKRKKAKYIY